ncbi:hypothetical protein E0485_22865 [Paenibacillus albiflavus]|uniref:Multi-tm2 domain protein n=1 Tax=Paenibacillus albiflavus TaxID=2545760 RepID=A0A4R4E185_9BACL|nr:hypothetical protein [Paenibacillus albiflavus]TCZ71073.1 hypothetical protein E0485_22865 [Paenibacillus albiflavus]
MIPVQGFTSYFLALFPGLGHLYLRRPGKAFAYGIPFWLIVVFFFFAYITHNTRSFLSALFYVDVILWFICFIDTLFSIQKINSTAFKQMQMQMSSQQPAYAQPSYDDPLAAPMYDGHNSTEPYDPERSKVLLLSFIPGLAHFHLGLMQRGLSIMALFFGIPIFIFFVVGMTRGNAFLAFLFALPIILFYAMYDAFEILKRKQIGMENVDRSFFEDMYQNRGKHKSRTVATLLSIFPGAGHLYIGMQMRGIQLMIAFILSLYMLDVLRFSVLLFLIPILWFFSFFDALQVITRMDRDEIIDKPIVSGLTHYHRWLGIALLLLGIYVIIDRISPVMFRYFLDNEAYSIFRQYFDIAIVSLILIISGIVLLFRRKKL